MKSSSVLDKIRASGEKPVPAWRFVASRWGVRAALVLALVAAAGAAALGLAEAWEPGADFMAGRLRHLPPPWALRALPLLHVAVAAALLATALAAFRRLPTGHRWRLPALLAVLFTLAAASAAAFGAVGGPRFADHLLRASVPGFSAWSDDRRERMFREVWMRPEEGVIAGSVVATAASGFVLEGLDGSRWDVEDSGAVAAPYASGARVRVFGEAIGSGAFRAQQVRPLSRKGAGFGRMGDERFRGMMGGPRGMMGGPRGAPAPADLSADPSDAPPLP